MMQTKMAGLRRQHSTTKKKMPHSPSMIARSAAFRSGTTQLSQLDLLERSLVMVFYVWFFWRFGQAFLACPSLPFGLPLVSESVAVFFLLTRRRANTFSFSVSHWLLALGATVVPMMTAPGDGPLEPEWLGESILVAGLCCQLATKLVLGRSFGLVAANRGLVRFGPYRLVRHPMYASYLLCHLGALYLNPTPWNLGVCAFCWVLQIPRLLGEEKHLREDAAYRHYEQVVPYRLLPGVF